MILGVLGVIVGGTGNGTGRDWGELGGNGMDWGGTRGRVKVTGNGTGSTGSSGGQGQ